MSDVRGHYLRALVEYVTMNGKPATDLAAGLSSKLRTMHPGGLIALHGECLQRLTANVEPEDALRCYELSQQFLMEWTSHADHVQSTLEESAAGLADESGGRREHSAALVMKTKYENILQHMDSGIILVDEDGFLTFINVRMCRLLGVPRTALLGLSLPKIAAVKGMSRGTRKLIIRLYRDMIRYRQPYYELVDESGRHLLISATYRDDMDGDLLISVKDVTEFKRIEMSAYQNDKLAMLGRISAAIAHEIRNPLTSIRGFFQLLRPEFAKLGKEDYVQIILEEIDRANEIIFEFLNSSKPTAPVKKEIAVADLVKEVALLFESEARMENCLIETGQMESSLIVRVDVKQIKQVLLNIVKNALEAVSGRRDKQGVIRIWAEQAHSFVHLYIGDNGNGIDTGTLSRLFDPFFTTKKEGTGLGLSVSYRIIKNHGGRIDVQSRVGEGTTFMVALPLT